MATACSDPPPDPPLPGEADETSALTGAEAVARATAWSDAKLHYCWAPNGKSDPNPACASVCNRTRNVEWDPYRSDCSGLVSWAWRLPAPGRTTLMFAPFQTDITAVIPASTLSPGDAVNSDHHVMLFKEWITPGKRAVFIEEPGCSSQTPYAHEVTSNVSIDGTSITLAYNGMTFNAIHNKAIKATTTADAGTTPSQDASTDAPTSDGAPLNDASGPSNGALDVVTCSGIEGWAVSATQPDTDVDVELSFFAADGASGAVPIRTTANVQRGDLSGVNAEHGFVLPVPLGVADGKPHLVFAYAVDDSGGVSNLLDGAPKTITCATPSFPLSTNNGVRRPVGAASVLTAWNLTALADVAQESDSAVSAYGYGPTFPASPQAVRAEGSDESTYVVDGTLARPIDVASLRAWRLTPKIVPPAELEALTLGPAWPKAPFIFRSAAAPDLYILDAKVLPNGVGSGGPVPPAASTGDAAAPAPDNGLSPGDEHAEGSNGSTWTPEPPPDSVAPQSGAGTGAANPSADAPAPTPNKGCSQAPSRAHGSVAPLGALVLLGLLIATRRRRGPAFGRRMSPEVPAHRERS